MKNSIYNQLEKISLPLLTSFSTDLTEHDKRTLSDYKGNFIHITRGTGTALIKLKKYNCTEERDGEKCLLDHYLNQDPLLIVYFDGSKLKKITADQARKEAQMYFNREIDNISINVEQKTDLNKIIKFVFETGTNSYKEAKAEFLKIFNKEKTVKAESENGMIFL